MYIPRVTLLSWFDNFISFSLPSPLVLLPSAQFLKFLFNRFSAPEKRFHFRRTLLLRVQSCSTKGALNRFSLVSVAEAFRMHPRELKTEMGGIF